MTTEAATYRIDFICGATEFTNDMQVAAARARSKVGVVSAIHPDGRVETLYHI